MLAAAERDLIHRDPLPSLEVLLNPGRVAEILARTLGDVEPPIVRLDYIRYKPGTSCLAGYEVQSGGLRLPMYAKTFQHPEKLTKWAERRSVPSQLGPGKIVLPDERLVIVLFPNDARVRRLKSLASEAAVATLLHQTAPSLPDGAEIQTLRYKPERRYVAKLLAGDTTAVLRLFSPSQFRSVSESAGAFASTDELLVPVLLGKSEKNCAMVVSWIEGNVLADVSRAGGEVTREAARAGAALAALHRQPVQLARASEGFEARVEGMAQTLSWLLPAETELFENVARRLARIGGDAAQHVPLHGDFYAKQVVTIADGAVGFLDFDEAVMGPPTVDLANFVAHAERDEMRGWTRSGTADGLSEAILEGYAGAGGVVSGDVRNQVARALFLLAADPFRHRDPQWPAATLRLVTRVSELLSGPARKPERNRLDDSALSFPDDPCDPAAATTRLRTLPRLSDVTVQSAAVIRHKMGRRAVVEYTIERDDKVDHLFGKIRAKGLDRKALEIQQQLWRDGFDDAAHDRIVVAEPFGAIESWHMIVQAKVDGVSATEALLAGRAEEVAVAAARALMKLHRSSITPPRVHTAIDELRILRDGFEEITHSGALSVDESSAILQRCERLLRDTSAAPVCVIHRDFHPEQLLIGSQKIAIIDLDLCAIGVPALDVGNFIAHLWELGLRSRGDASAFEAAQKTFEQAYIQGNINVSLDDVRAWSLVSFARHVVISQRMHERRGVTSDIIEFLRKEL